MEAKVAGGVMSEEYAGSEDRPDGWEGSSGDSRPDRSTHQVYVETLQLGYRDFVRLAARVRDGRECLAGLTHAESLGVIDAGELRWQELGTPV